MKKVSALLFAALFTLVLLVSASAYANVCVNCDRDQDSGLRARDASRLGSMEFSQAMDRHSGDLDDFNLSGVREDWRGPHWGREIRPHPFWGHKGPQFGLEGLSVNRSLNSDPVTTPEPGTLGLLGTGLIGLAALIRRRIYH